MSKTLVGRGGPGLEMPGERWIVAAFAVAGTSLLLGTTSPGLRTDLGELAAYLGELAASLAGFAAFLGNAYAAFVEAVILPLGPFAPVVFFGVMVAQVFLAPIPSAPVTLSGAIAFGVWEGFALSLAGSVVGSVLAFLAVRRWGEPMVARLVGEGVYRQYADKLDDRGWWLFAVLLLPFTPDDAAVALAGLSTLSFRRFFVMMVLGRIPATVLTVLLASGAVAGSTATVFTAGLTVVALLSLGFVYRGRLEGWLSRSAGGDQAPVEASAEVSRTGEAR